MSDLQVRQASICAATMAGVLREFQRSSKLITTRSLVGRAWQDKMKPCSTSGFSRVKFFSISVVPAMTLQRQVQHTPALQE